MVINSNDNINLNIYYLLHHNRFGFIKFLRRSVIVNSSKLLSTIKLFFVTYICGTWNFFEGSFTCFD